MCLAEGVLGKHDTIKINTALTPVYLKVDEFGQVILSDKDIERIATRVVDKLLNEGKDK